MAEPDLKVGVTVDDKTAKGIKSAKKNVTEFEKNLKSLAKTFGIAFSADAIVSFGKASVKAFLDDEAAATKLANTVKNLGYGFATGYVSDYISNLEKTASVADDELRPAFQTLISQTGSLTQAQSLLNTAIQTSRGSGESLTTVANDLAQAYVGNTKGLKKYYLGLDSATLATKSFAEVQQLLNNQFSGSNEAYLNTYAGQVNALGIAWGNFQETAGGALLSLASFGSGEQAKGLSNVATILGAIGHGFELVAAGANSVMSLLNVFNPKKGFLGLFNPAPGSSPLAGIVPDKTETKDFLTQYKEIMARIARENKKSRDAQIAAAKKLTAEQKKQALLKKQSSLFDIDQIQLIAALQGKLSDEDRKRAELQLALLQGNEDKAKKLTDEIANSIDKTGNLAKYLSTLPDANNPFKSWEAYLNAIEAQVGRIAAAGSAGIGNTQVMPQTNAVDFSGFALNTSAPGTAGSGAQFGASTPWAQAASVNIQIDGKTIASALLDQSLSGNQAYVDRRTGGFNW